jgi:hypothetical protein
MALRGSGFSAFVTAPRHHSSIRREPALENFVPTNEFFAVLCQKCIHAANEIALQLVCVVQAIGLDHGLAVGAAFPACFGGFVASDVYKRTWEKWQNFF